MARAHDVHVIANTTRGGWNMRRAGRPVSHHSTQEEALSIGRRVARKSRVDLATHGRDGRVRSRDSYGNERSTMDAEH
jgi:hypothetical protein